LIEKTKKEDVFEVWPENWAALQMFLRLQTQWNVGVNGVIGLNYQSLEFLFRIYETKKPRKMLEKIRLIERGALDAIRRAREKQGD